MQVVKYGRSVQWTLVYIFPPGRKTGGADRALDEMAIDHIESLNFKKKQQIGSLAFGEEYRLRRRQSGTF